MRGGVEYERGGWPSVCVVWLTRVVRKIGLLISHGFLGPARCAVQPTSCTSTDAMASSTLEYSIVICTESGYCVVLLHEQVHVPSAVNGEGIKQRGGRWKVVELWWLKDRTKSQPSQHKAELRLARTCGEAPAAVLIETSISNHLGTGGVIQSVMMHVWLPLSSVVETFPRCPGMDRRWRRPPARLRGKARVSPKSRPMSHLVHSSHSFLYVTTQEKQHHEPSCNSVPKYQPVQPRKTFAVAVCLTSEAIPLSLSVCKPTRDLTARAKRSSVSVIDIRIDPTLVLYY